VVEGGNELSRRQVAARAKNHDAAGFHGFALGINPARHKFIQLSRCVHRESLDGRTDKFNASQTTPPPSVPFDPSVLDFGSLSRVFDGVAHGE
jgi:hypothetical protein